jgi:hypothetical protein
MLQTLPKQILCLSHKDVRAPCGRTEQRPSEITRITFQPSIKTFRPLQDLPAQAFNHLLISNMDHLEEIFFSVIVKKSVFIQHGSVFFPYVKHLISVIDKRMSLMMYK